MSGEIALASDLDAVRRQVESLGRQLRELGNTPQRGRMIGSRIREQGSALEYIGRRLAELADELSAIDQQQQEGERR